MGLIESINTWLSEFNDIEKAVFILISVLALVIFSFVIGHAVKYFVPELFKHLKEKRRRSRYIKMELAQTKAELDRVREERTRDIIESIRHVSNTSLMTMEQAADAFRMINMNIQGNAAERMAEQMALDVDREILEERELADESGHPISMYSESSFLSADSMSSSLTSDEEATFLYGHAIPPETRVREQRGEQGLEYVFICSLCGRVYEGVDRRQFVGASRLNREFIMRSVAESRNRHMLRIHRVPTMQAQEPEWEAGEIEEAPPVRLIRMKKRQ